MGLVDFIKGSYTEMVEKVEWPKWPDLQSSTIVVSVATLILAIIMLGVDSFFSKAIEGLLSILIGLFN